jgi:Bacterial pre-peptidase C-terminal domain
MDRRIFSPLALCASLCSLCLCGESLRAEPPVASYLFPPGGQRGTTVNFKVGGLFLHKSCAFELLGPGVTAPTQLQRTDTLWLEGPLLTLPDSQQAEDYPKDLAGSVRIAAGAPPGERFWRVRTAQGATPALKFVVGELPEVVEEEIPGDPIPVPVTLPVTINGRIFPREDVDVWAFDLKKGQTVTADVNAVRLGSPLDARLQVLDPAGRVVAEKDSPGGDPLLHFTAAADGKYAVRIHDTQFRGSQAHVYRLTLTPGPWVDRVFPLGGKRGAKTKFEVTGTNVPAEPVEVALPADGPWTFAHRFSVGGQQTNPVLFDLDDLPEVSEADAGKPVPLPAVANGRIGKPGEVDSWTVALHKGDVREFELRAARLGSPLLGVLTVCDSAGKELARAESGTGPAEALLRFTAPADGTFTVRVADQFHSRGGPEFAYRLRLTEPGPADFRLALAADVLALPQGGQAKLKVQAERVGGHAEPITLAVEGLPEGVTAQPATIPAGQPAAEITLKADAKAVVQGARLTVRGTAKDVTRTAVMPALRGAAELDSVLLAVTVPTPFKIVGEYDMRWAARGSVHRRHYRVERNGYDGPLEVTLADRQARHLQGVTGPTVTVPAGASEFDYPVQLPPWMETGRTCRVCVQAFGVVKDANGTEQVVSFSSVQQNEQLVAVIEPGRLGVEAERTSLVAVPGKEVELPVRVSRAKGLPGPVKLELIVAPHLHGITAEPVEVAVDKDTARVVIKFGDAARGPFNLPVVLRATLTDKGDPVIAETKIEILPPR